MFYEKFNKRKNLVELIGDYKPVFSLKEGDEPRNRHQTNLMIYEILLKPEDHLFEDDDVLDDYQHVFYIHYMLCIGKNNSLAVDCSHLARDYEVYPNLEYPDVFKPNFNEKVYKNMIDVIDKNLDGAISEFDRAYQELPEEFQNFYNSLQPKARIIKKLS